MRRLPGTMRKKRFGALALAAVALVALAAGGCGGIPPTPAPTGTPAVTSAAPAVPSPSPTPTLSPSPSPSPTPSLTPSPAPTASPTPSPTPTPTLTPTLAPAPTGLTISVNYIDVSDKYVEIKAAYPVVSGMADAAFQKKFNAAVKSDLKKKTDQLVADAKSNYDSSIANGYEYVKFTLDSAVKVHLNDGAVLSLSIQIGEYAGGAHDINDALYYTLANARPAKQFTLFKLFTKSSTAKNRIEKSINAAIAKDPDGYLENPAYTLSDDMWFYLTENTLHIVFPEASIAPYAAGQPDFGIALSSFKDILVKGIPR